MLLSFPSKQYSLLSAVLLCRKMTVRISVNDKDLTKSLERFFSNEKLEACCTKEMCSMLIEKLCKTMDMSNAVSMLQYLHDKQMHPTVNTYNTLLASAGQANYFNLFQDIFHKLLLSKSPPNTTTYLNVSKILPSMPESNVRSFIRDVSEITALNDPTIVNMIIHAVAKSGQINTSLMMFEELKNHDCKIDTVTFNTVLAILGKVGLADKMLSEFSLMKELGYSLDTITYDTLINCLRRLGRWDLCKVFAKEMVEKGFELDLQAYTALIDGLGRAGHVNDAMILFDEMKKCHRPSIYVYRAMISNLNKFGKTEAAMNLQKEMNDSSSMLVGPEDFRKERGKVHKWNVSESF